MRETTYFGIRLNGEARVYKRTVVRGGGGRGELTAPLGVGARFGDRSPDSFEWGFIGPSPLQLSAALLADHLNDDDLALSLCEAFLRAVIARIDPELSWTLTASRLAEMAAALAANQLPENLGREHLAEVVDFNEYKLSRAK
jgi:hypothetical protein